jgi:hypothetical protein
LRVDQRVAADDGAIARRSGGEGEAKEKEEKRSHDGTRDWTVIAGPAKLEAEALSFGKAGRRGPATKSAISIYG